MLKRRVPGQGGDGGSRMEGVLVRKEWDSWAS